MNETTATSTPLVDQLRATDPALFASIMAGMDRQIVHGVARDLGVSPRTARAALRTTGLLG